MTPFGECVVLNDGRRVVAPWLQRGIAIGDRRIDGPVLLCPDAALDSLGRIWVVGKDAIGPGGFVWCETAGVWWPVPSAVFGRRMVLRADGAQCRIAFTTTAFAWKCLSVTPAGQMTTIAAGTIPSGEGAHGMRDWDAAGTPRPLAPLDETVGGMKVRSLVTVGDTSIACSLFDPEQVVIVKGGQVGTLSVGGMDWPTPRISANGKFWCGARYVGEVLLGGEIPATMPVLNRTAPIVTIGRPMWGGFINHTPHATPGNCVMNVADAIVRATDGTPIAQYVASSDESNIDALEQAIAAAQRSSPLPVLAYWTRQAQAIRVPKGADIVGVEMYRLATESLTAAEARWRAALARVPQAAAICQCYTSNAKNTTDLAALVPVYARVLKDCRNLWGALVFSGYGRATGLQDHPEVQSLWAQLMAGIPSAPTIEEEFMEPWKVSAAKFTFDPSIERGKAFEARTAFGNGIEIAFQKDAADVIHFAIYENGVLKDRSGAPRHVEVKG